MKIESLLNSYWKVIVWGTGNYYEKFKSFLPEQIVYFVDNNPEKWQTVLDGKKILSPEVLHNEEIEGTLIVVCNNYFDEITVQLQEYGEFDVIDIVNIAMVKEHECDVKRVSHCIHDSGHMVLICAGIHAIWQRNGARKFIEGQIDILHRHGYQTIEVAPLMYLKKRCLKEEYLTVSQDRNYIGLFSIDEFVESYSYQTVIIHSLYYNYQILVQLAKNKNSRGKVLYYLHDYFILCKNRFLYHDNKLCLDANNSFHCNECNEANQQMEIQDFHRNFFIEYDVILIAPSLDTKQRVEMFYRGISVKVMSHLSFREKLFVRKKHHKLRIAFLGIAIWQKGWNDFVKVAEKNYNRYDFFCIGDCEKSKQKEYITYLLAELGSKNHLTMLQMLQKYEIDIAYIGSILPETYSYTYFEAYEAGCFVISTNRSGNVCREIEKNRNGKVFHNVDEINQWLRTSEKVREEVEFMNKRITQVKDNENFIALIE